MSNIRIQNINNKICFGKTDNAPKAQVPAESKPDSVTLNKKSEPPKITILQAIFPFTMTNEQIKQINESKKLPENLCFIYQDWSQFRGHKFELPFYSINLDIGYLPNKTKFLPEGYMVVRDFYGAPEARKILKPEELNKF